MIVQTPLFLDRPLVNGGGAAFYRPAPGKLIRQPQRMKPRSRSRARRRDRHPCRPSQPSIKHRHWIILPGPRHKQRACGPHVLVDVSILFLHAAPVLVPPIAWSLTRGFRSLRSLNQRGPYLFDICFAPLLLLLVLVRRGGPRRRAVMTCMCLAKVAQAVVAPVGRERGTTCTNVPIRRCTLMYLGALMTHRPFTIRATPRRRSFARETRFKGTLS